MNKSNLWRSIVFLMVSVATITLSTMGAIEWNKPYLLWLSAVGAVGIVNYLNEIGKEIEKVK